MVRRIAIVNDGIFKFRDPDHYLGTCISFKDMAEETRLLDRRGKKTDKPAATALVVESAEEARSMVAKGEVDMVIFVSVAMDKEAKKLQSEFPRLQVFTFVNQPIKGERFLVPTQLLTVKGFERMIMTMDV